MASCLPRSAVALIGRAVELELTDDVAYALQQPIDHPAG